MGKDISTNQLSPDNNKSGILSPNTVVSMAQTILGLKIIEIAKLIGVSRATLDLHRKGKPVSDNEAYIRVSEFLTEVKNKYDDQLSNFSHNILIDKKSLSKHLISNAKNLKSTHPVLEQVFQKSASLTVSKVDMSKRSRLTGIGNQS